MSDSLALPITQAARHTAHAFGQQHSNPDKAQQVYLNTLAVWTVKDYLTLMEIPFALEASDCWNPVLRFCADVADLVIPEVGRLECRPIVSRTNTYPLPPEVWSDRIGYIMVLIEENHRQAQILGFTPTVMSGCIALDQLQPLESLLAHISEFIPTNAVQPTLLNTYTDLSQWLQGVFDTSWQVVEDLFSSPPPNPIFQFRTAASTSTLKLPGDAVNVKRAKLVQFNTQAAAPVILIINLFQSEINSQSTVCVQLRPTDNGSTLPVNLSLKVLDHQHNTFLEAQSRQADNYLQLEFNGLPGEQFRLDLVQDDQIISETFVI